MGAAIRGKVGPPWRDQAALSPVGVCHILTGVPVAVPALSK